MCIYVGYGFSSDCIDSTLDKSRLYRLIPYSYKLFTVGVVVPVEPHEKLVDLPSTVGRVKM